MSSLVVFKRLCADRTDSPLAPFMQIVAIEAALPTDFGRGAAIAERHAWSFLSLMLAREDLGMSHADRPGPRAAKDTVALERDRVEAVGVLSTLEVWIALTQRPIITQEVAGEIQFLFEFSDGLHRSDFTLALFAFLPLGASRSHDKGDLLDQDGSILDF
jgi:hypothetical protein